MKNVVIAVWDLPVRIFHWTLLLLVVAAFCTGMAGGSLIVWHGWLGIAIAGLLAFRLVWGVVGSTYARFATFVPGPGRIAAYLRGQWRGVGHNPIGALSVLGLLGILVFQAGSGLVSNDDIAFEGPLYTLVSKDTSDWLSSLHRQNFWVIIALVSLHVLAILFYAHVKKDNLVKPMITGVKEVSDPALKPAQGGGAAAFVLAAAVAGFAVWAAMGGMLPPPPPPPPPPPQAVPAW
ncbi:cytochrome b/b6 domain-containing protein [Thauera linaloolentis]|uniref:Hydrogenase cytochrome b-type subunit n=1 Tax=Thauera linaloolentis (strain DSM 12138 / JCM 21573 / CCUG 41526 / CIP 105981 / IAM 15112 / NBRC 102519 / 47Lol) TaxID=1123367 RepID=N6YCD0_THAL4|nr:cytochrome b/b6 domain-containing protein [Thauera linaloolentis]ENO89185.1 hydrogenase cytochrome b-type subunit [Thauera linaloolentis 47Lol = DSM 12138]MCM8567283.1 cytochrome b/b6 domain-containing protein [Thauera linaloolentis]